jgi:hypothetical protein
MVNPSSQTPACPACGLADRVEKVSTIYMDAIGAGRLPTVRQGGAAGSKSGRLTDLPDKELRSLIRRLAPPASRRKSMTRLIHPDQMILSFSVMILLFVLIMLRNQPRLLLPVGGILIVFYALYLFRRPALIRRYEGEIRSFNDERRSVEEAVGVWMKLYYCGRDDGVFLPGEEELIPLDNMASFLNERAASPISARTKMNRR